MSIALHVIAFAMHFTALFLALGAGLLDTRGRKTEGLVVVALAFCAAAFAIQVIA